MNFFLLLTDAFSCFLYGIVVTAVIMVRLYFVLKTLSQGIVRTPVFYITGVVLAVLLLIQTSLMIGAIQAKDAVDSALIYMNQLLENYSGIVGANDSQQILDAVTEEFPIIGVYLNLADFSGNAVSDFAESSLPVSMATSKSNFSPSKRDSSSSNFLTLESSTSA